MPVKPFSFPFPETRFFHTTKDVYKFKIRYGKHFNSEDAENYENIGKELVDSIRAVLANLDNLHPFVTEHFIIFPYKSKWDSAPRLRFKHGHKFLLPFPYVFTIYIEPKTLLKEKQDSSTNISDQNYRDDDQETQCDGSCSDLEEPVEEKEDPCTPSGLDTRRGGILSFLTSLTPFRFLFGWRNSLK